MVRTELGSPFSKNDSGGGGGYAGESLGRAADQRPEAFDFESPMPGGAQFPAEEMRTSLGTLDQDPVHLAFSNIVAGLTALREDGVSSRLGHPGDGPEIAARRRGWQDGIDRALGLIRKELGSLVDSPVLSSQTLVITDQEV